MFKRLLYRVKIAFIIVCWTFLIIGAVSHAADNSLNNKSQRCAKEAELREEEKPNLYEEKRDNKTFQVVSLIIKAKPETVFKTFTDYKQASTMFSYCKQCRILSVKGPTKQVVFQTALADGLIKFDYVLEFQEYPPTLVRWHRVSGAFKVNEGYWKFEPLEKGQFTLVTYSKYVDAGFFIPQFFVKQELRRDMPVIMTELKTAVEKAN